MRTAEICSTCATYISAACILYNGDYLSSTDISPLDSLEVALGKVNGTFTAISGAGVPSSQIPAFVGQLYINTSTEDLWIGLGTTSVNWGLLATISTTTTTSTTTTAP